MTYNTKQLITNAYYLSGIVSRDLQTVSPSQISDGLFLLNSLLNIKSANVRLIPYFKQYDFNAVIGQEKYFVPNLLQIETLTFNIGDVRFSSQYVTRRPYFGSGRVDNIQSLPFSWHFERTLGGTDIYLYFLPQEEFPMKIWGKFALSDVTLDQDLSLTLDLYYIEYLRYALAEYICNDYNITFSPRGYQRLKELEGIIRDISPPDLSLSKISSLESRPGLNWGDVNLGDGWRPF